MRLAQLVLAILFASVSAVHVWGTGKSSPADAKADAKAGRHWPIYEDEVPEWTSIRKAKSRKNEVAGAPESGNHTVKTEAHLAWERSPGMLQHGLLWSSMLPWTWVIGVLAASAEYDAQKKLGNRTKAPTLKGAQTIGAINGIGMGIGLGIGGAMYGNKQDKFDRCAQMPIVQDFDLEQYISKPWYPQYQMPQAYQTERELECTSAQYLHRCDPYDKDNLCESGGYTIDVINMARTLNRDNSTRGTLCARTTSTPGRLKVGPCDMPPSFSGDYWVVAFKDGFRGYAIVVGGQPNKWDWRTDRCTYINSQTHGMWIFNRRRQAPPPDINKVFKEMHALGLDTSAMLPTPQYTDCEGFDNTIEIIEQERKLMEIQRDINRGVATGRKVLKKAKPEKIAQNHTRTMAQVKTAAMELAISSNLSSWCTNSWLDFLRAWTAANEAVEDYRTAVYNAGMLYFTDPTDYVVEGEITRLQNAALNLKNAVATESLAAAARADLFCSGYGVEQPDLTSDPEPEK